MEQNELIVRLEGYLNPLLEGTDMFVTDIRIKPTNNFKVFVDADSGMSIDKCAKLNRALYHALEESGAFPDGDFSLELSSPGVDEPITQLRQYQKNIGRELELTLDEEQTIIGKLTSVEEDHIVLEIKQGKKKETITQSIPFADIRKAVVQISFK